jgi:hypothetical protein
VGLKTTKLFMAPRSVRIVGLDLIGNWDNNPAFPNPCLVPYHCRGRGRRSFILFSPFLIYLMYVDVEVTFINDLLIRVRGASMATVTCTGVGASGIGEGDITVDFPTADTATATAATATVPLADSAQKLSMQVIQGDVGSNHKDKDREREREKTHNNEKKEKKEKKEKREKDKSKDKDKDRDRDK